MTHLLGALYNVIYIYIHVCMCTDTMAPNWGTEGPTKFCFTERSENLEMGPIILRQMRQVVVSMLFRKEF